MQSQTRLSRIYLQSVLLHRVLLLVHVSETSVKQVTGRETRGFSDSKKKAKLMEMGTTSCIFFTPKQLHLCSF